MKTKANKIIKSILPQIYLLKGGKSEMKIEKIIIDNICGIKHIDVKFNKGLNLICGANGVGKTTILKSIVYEFFYKKDNFVKKHYGSEKGSVSIWVYGIHNPFKYTIKYFTSESADTEDRIYYSQPLSFDNVSEIKSWFIKKFLFSKVDNVLNEFEKNNFKLSKCIFKLLDNNLSIKTINTGFEIILKNNNTEIHLDMLSDGYKSYIFTFLNIIKEIEYQYPHINAVDFDGVIMIDEIDIHLHPQWQTKFIKLLTQIFHNAQIIATTHSPSVLQNAKRDEIIPLYRDENDNICVKQLNLSEYGLQGWTFEEILQYVMGISSTTSDLYSEIINKFDKAMNTKNKDEILESYEILKKILHPQNPMRQLLEIQVSEWNDYNNKN